MVKEKRINRRENKENIDRKKAKISVGGKKRNKEKEGWLNKNISIGEKEKERMK